MSPELVTVLLAVQRRAKTLSSDGVVPLTIRYDSNEKIHGPALPHLFVHRVGTRTEVISTSRLMRLLRELAALADLRDPAQPGQLVTFTPHDFRRLFATELVGAGLPLHIAATLLGHLSLETTRGYTAVFPEHVITAHEALIERRRALRADAEMRPASGQEWDDFQEHFLRRKVALGDCHRPYGTPCVHEHACVKCRFLAVDPAAAGRIEEMTTNTCDRIAEARDRGWLGELSALEEQLAALRGRSAELTAKAATSTV
jgi:Phage integrase family